MHGVRGIRNERDVVVIQISQRQVRDAFFGTDERQDFSLRVEFHAKILFVMVRDGLAKSFFDFAVRSRVAVIFGDLGGFA